MVQIVYRFHFHPNAVCNPDNFSAEFPADRLEIRLLLLLIPDRNFERVFLQHWKIKSLPFFLLLSSFQKEENNLENRPRFSVDSETILGQTSIRFVLERQNLTVSVL